MPEQLGLQKLLRNGRTVHCNERLYKPGRIVVNGPCDQLFSRTRFSLYQNRHVTGSDLADGLVDLPHRGRVTYDAVFEQIALLQLILERGDLKGHLPCTVRLFDNRIHDVKIERLCQVVVSSALHRLDSILHSGFGSHDNYKKIAFELTHLVEKVKARNTRHLDIEDGKVIAFTADKPECLIPVSGKINGKPFFPQSLGEHPAHALFVIGSESYDLAILDIK